MIKMAATITTDAFEYRRTLVDFEHSEGRLEARRRSNNEIVYEATGEVTIVKPGKKWTMLLESGEVITILKVKNCGCGGGTRVVPR